MTQLISGNSTCLPGGMSKSRDAAAPPVVPATKKTGPDWFCVASVPSGSSKTLPATDPVQFHQSAVHSPIVLPATLDPPGRTVTGSALAGEPAEKNNRRLVTPTIN